MMVLEEYGVNMDWAIHGQAGLEKIQQMGEGYYDAVLMDIQMPVMNGYEAARAIRGLKGAYYQSIPIIAISANDSADDVRTCLDAGMNAHIGKPYEPETLIAQLHSQIGKH